MPREYVPLSLSKVRKLAATNKLAAAAWQKQLSDVDAAGFGDGDWVIMVRYSDLVNAARVLNVEPRDLTDNSGYANSEEFNIVAKTVAALKADKNHYKGRWK